MATTNVDNSDTDNMPVHKIDLSDTAKYHSDGVPKFRHMTREDNGMFLKNLTEAFNNNSHFVTELGKLFPTLTSHLSLLAPLYL